MGSEKDARPADKVERRLRRGTWPWFALNIILFPGPAHLTLLRIKDFSSKKNLLHLGLTLLLFVILFSSAALQLTMPGIGRLWMLAPLLSGIVVLYTQRNLKNEFKTAGLAAAVRDHKAFLVGTILLFAVISFLPMLDLIELGQKPADGLTEWFAVLPFWQDALIMAVSLLLLFCGYLVNASPVASVNRAFILYACFMVISNEIILIMMFTSSWMKIPIGFWMQTMAVLLGAVLALDYWDARTFGQYLRRFFFLTATKGLTFLFLFYCFLGLPQKAASVFSELSYQKVRPPAIEFSPRHLIISERDRFRSAHEAARRMRSLYTRSCLHPSRAPEANWLTEFIKDIATTIIPADADVCRLAEKIGSINRPLTYLDSREIPFFRPIQPGWDVMFTAMLLQGTIAANDIDKYVAGFKARLPNTSKGQLPGIDKPYDVHYISLATFTQIDFIEARYDDIANLLAHDFYPVLALRLAGKDYWSVLLKLDQKSGLAWFRIETVSKTQKAIQVLFDANESGPLRDEIISRTLIPVSIDYLRSTLANNSSPAVIFSKTGLSEALPDQYTRENLLDINRAIARSSVPDWSSFFITACAG